MNDTSSTPSATPIPNNYGVATSMADVQNQINEMEAFFETGATLPVDFRLRQLRRLQAYLLAHEQEALDALHADLGKSAFESYATELGLVYDEIRLYLRKLRQWARPRRVPTPLAHFPSSSTVYPYPFGVAAVLSPWNYPLQLTLIPLVDAIGAGNCVALKPSKTSPHTSQFLRDMCRELFDPRYVYCWHGSNDMNDWLLQVEFDKIMFTGSPRVGREIMTAAAQNLTSVTLELGGKSPVFIAADADIRRAAQRIAWGKCLNSGQTCVGPDYALVHEDVADEFVEELQRWIHEYYGEDVLASPDYPHMINQKHFDMVCQLIDDRPQGTRIAFGGRRNPTTLQIEPTVVIGRAHRRPAHEPGDLRPGAARHHLARCGRGAGHCAVDQASTGLLHLLGEPHIPAAHPGCRALRRGRHQRRGHSRKQQLGWTSAACRTPASAPTTARWALTRSPTTSQP